MKRIAVILLTVLLLSGCALTKPAVTTEPTVPATTSPVPTPPPTTEPITTPTTVPTEPPVTVPPTEATEPKPLFTPEFWQTEPEYLSYKEYFSRDRYFINKSVTSWLVTHKDTGYRIDLDFGSGLTIHCDALDQRYYVPDAAQTMQAYKDATLLGSDGKYAYLANSTHIIQIDLATGAVTELVSSSKLQNVYLCNGVVLYYIRYAWGEPYICRMYIPEQREDILRILDKPIDDLWLRRPKSSQSEVIWVGYNPEITALFEAELKNPNSSYQINGSDKMDLSYLWEVDDVLSIPDYAYATRWIYLELQNNTGVNALFRGVYDCFLGSYSESIGPLSDCCFGTNLPHDHYFWEITDGDLPAPLDEQWLPISLPDAQMPASSMIWEMRQTDKASYFITENNTIVKLSNESDSLTTVYQANYGQLRELSIEDKQQESLYVADGNKVVKIDTESSQYTPLVEHEHILELFLWDDGRVYFSVCNGMFYKQLIYDPETQTFEETRFI